MKKFLFILMSMVMILSILSGCKTQQKSSPIDDFTYEFGKGEVMITGYHGPDLEVIIPSVIENRPVTCIGAETFGEYDMTSLVIPEGVKVIHYSTLNECYRLEKISLPESFEGFYWGDYFDDDYDMMSPTYALDNTKWYEDQPDGVLYIDDILVGVKGRLSTTTVEIQKGTKSILPMAFYNQKNITEVNIPNSVKLIGDYAFRSCDSLKSLEIPDGTVIGENILYGEIYGDVIYKEDNN